MKMKWWRLLVQRAADKPWVEATYFGSACPAMYDEAQAEQEFARHVAMVEGFDTSHMTQFAGVRLVADEVEVVNEWARP